MSVAPAFPVDHVERAAALGLTRVMEVDVGEWSLRLAVAQDAELDGAFRAICLDTGTDLLLNGWMLSL